MRKKIQFTNTLCKSEIHEHFPFHLCQEPSSGQRLITQYELHNPSMTFDQLGHLLAEKKIQFSQTQGNPAFQSVGLHLTTDVAKHVTFSPKG